MWLLELLGIEKQDRTQNAPSSQTDTIRQIVRELDKLDVAQARYIACFAYLLSRVAHADLDIKEEEILRIEQIVMQVGGLPEEQAVLVTTMAKTHTELFGGTENFLVTREFNGIATREQKLNLIRCLFAVGAADGVISTVEDNEIIQIASELNLERSEVGSIRVDFQEYLGVLK
jgi:Tellurite resistance protein TerB.